MNPINKRRSQGTESIQHFLGVVMDNNDPEFRGRCKINVFGIFDDIDTKDLPWAFQRGDISFGADGGTGRFSTPKIGSIVSVIFNNGDYYSPEYTGMQELSNDLKSELASSYEGAHSLIYDGIENIRVYYTASKGLVLDTKGSIINISNDNKITMDSKGSIDLITPLASINISNSGSITATGGSVPPNAKGGWNCLPTDPYTGMIHVGDTLIP